MERPPEALDLERLGLGTYAKLTLDGHDVETIELDELVAQYAVPVTLDALEQLGIMPARSTDDAWPNEQTVNLMQSTAPVPDGYEFTILLDVDAEARRKMLRFDGMRFVDAMIGIDAEVDASEAAATATAFAVRSSPTAAKRQRVA